MMRVENSPPEGVPPEEEMWAAVRSRDYRYDGSFVFGVRSTKVYCLPSCASRRPSRAQVVFFNNPGLAENGGFRACLRCHPNSSTGISSHRRRVEEACRFIEENTDRKLGLNALAEHVGMSPFHFQRVFKKLVGMTPREYSESSKLDRAKLLMRGGESVRKSIYKVGYSSTSWLYSNPTVRLGMHPANYRNGGEGMRIHYSILDSPLGRLLVAGTESGICSVSLADSDEKLESHLRNEYPRAKLEKDERIIAPWAARILRYLSSEEAVQLNDLPLDIRATSFQHKVWKELQKIPYGVTRSYSQIARRISHPEAARAVANACAANPVPLVVPCHRVIKNNGSLGGYGLGVQRKKSLLEKERELANEMAN